MFKLHINSVKEYVYLAQYIKLILYIKIHLNNHCGFVNIYSAYIENLIK